MTPLSPPDTSRLTVVIPTYNRSASLRRCVEGLFRCEWAGRSVVVRVVDDGSPDDTRAVVAALAEAAPAGFRVHHHRQENAGQSAARNTGIQAADTDLILFLDDDCVPDPGWVRALAEADWSVGPEPVGGVGGRLVAAAQEHWVSRFCRFIRYNEYPPDAGPIRFLNSANCAYRRDVLLAIGGYERNLPRGVDHDLGWRVVLAGYRLAYAPEAVVNHHHREERAVLVRDYWRRGHTNVLRRMQWEQPRPTEKDLARERKRMALLRLHPPLLPLDALRLLRQGVPARDCLPFAYLRWRLRLAAREGKAAMIERLLKGEQTVERSAPLPRDEQGRVRALPWMKDAGGEG